MHACIAMRLGPQTCVLPRVSRVVRNVDSLLLTFERKQRKEAFCVKQGRTMKNGGTMEKKKSDTTYRTSSILSLPLTGYSYRKNKMPPLVLVSTLLENV